MKHYLTLDVLVTLPHTAALLEVLQAFFVRQPAEILWVRHTWLAQKFDCREVQRLLKVNELEIIFSGTEDAIRRKPKEYKRCGVVRQ